jgi:O-antigen/teichoic acid export membrane protein
VLTTIKKFKSNENVVKYFLNTSWMLGEQVLRLVAGLLVGIWVARYLGPAGFGMFSYVLAYTSIFSGIAKLGLDSIIIRDLVNWPELRDVYLGTAFWLKILGGVSVLGLIILSLLISNNDSLTALYIIIIAAGFIFQSFEVVDFYFQSQVLVKFVSICKFIQLTISSLVKIYLVLTERDLLYFVIVSFCDQVTLALSLFIVYRSKVKVSFYTKFDKAIAKKLLNDSWPLILASLVIIIYMRIDQVMIKAILGDYEAGIYSSAVRLSEVWYFIPTLITASLFPAIVEAKQFSESLYYQRLQKLFTFLVWIAILLAVLVSTFSEWLIVLLFGDAYREASPILIVHIWTGVFVSMGVASSSWLVNESLQKIAFYRAFIGAIINIVLILLLIPRYGLIGVALATLFAQMAAALFFDIFLKQTRKIFIMKANTINPFVFLKKELR